MAGFLFVCLVLALVLLVRQASKEARVLPESQPGLLVRVVGDRPENDVCMNVAACICSCREWQANRRSFAPAAPMRLCRHLTSYFAAHEDMLPPSLKGLRPLVTVHAATRSGLPCGPGTEYGHLEKKPYVLYARKASLPGVIFVLGSVRYEYDLERRCWEPYPPPKAAYFAFRARQLAEMAHER